MAERTDEGQARPRFARAALAALPEVLLGPARADDATRRPRLVNTGYGGSVRSSFSGSSAYLAEAGIGCGVLDGVFELYSATAPDRGLQVRGAAWKLRRMARRQRSGGFKFAPEFSRHLWHRHLPALAGVDVISNFQLLSEEFFARRAELGIGAYFYLDGTLHDYLRGYQAFDVAGVDAATINTAIETERHGYEQADAVAVMSRFTADTLVERYGLARDRITVIGPGANITDELADTIMTARRARLAGQNHSADLVVGFVGVYPERKGLPKLAEAVASLRRDGVPIRLRVAGRCPDDIAALDGVEALGYISKSAEPERFADALAGIDLGVQLSTVEMFGIAILEFLRCGIPALATEVGGVVDVLAGGGSLGVPGSASADEVAAMLRGVVEDHDLRERLNAAAAARAEDVRWEHSARALADLVAATSR